MAAIDRQTIKDSKKVLQIMENAQRAIDRADDEKKQNLKQFFNDCYNRYAELQAEEEGTVSTPFVREFYKFFHAYEQALTENPGTRQPTHSLKKKLRNTQKKMEEEEKAIIVTIEELVQTEGGTDGYKFLIENELKELNAEYLVLQHKN